MVGKAIIGLLAVLNPFIVARTATDGLLDLDDASVAAVVDRYIVVLRENTSDEAFEGLLDEIEQEGITIMHVYENALKGFAILASQELIDRISNEIPEVEYIERDQQVELFEQQLLAGVDRIDGDESFAAAGDGEGSVDSDIAIIDTGIDVIHPDLGVHRSAALSLASKSNLPAQMTTATGRTWPALQQQRMIRMGLWESRLAQGCGLSKW